MPALKEFANFITLNTANLAETYAQLLEESGSGYESIAKNRRISSARKLLKAVSESYELEMPDPLARMFNPQNAGNSGRWPADIDPPQPLLEIEYLGQTLVPVVTSLEAGKFLWQLLSQVRIIVAQSLPPPPPLPVAETPPSLPAASKTALSTRPLPSLSQVQPAHLRPQLREAEPALSSTGSYLPLLISLNEATMLLGEAGFIDCNEATLKIFGYTSKEEFIKTHPSQQSPPQQPDGQDSVTAANEKIAAAYREGSHRFEWLHCRVDGTLFPAEVILTRVELDGQQILQATVRDITLYKQTEQAVQESEHWLKTIMDSVQAGIVIVDAETREIVDANPAALRMIGAARKKVLGSICHKFICPAEKNRCPVCDLGQTVDNSERVLLTAQGKTVPILKNVVTVSLKGRQYLIENFVDIIDRKQTEEKLRLNERMFRSSLDVLPQSIYRKDREDRITFANKAYLNSVGMSFEELVGKTTHQLYPKELADKYVADDLKVLETGKTIDIVETHHISGTGDTIYVQAVKTPIKDADGVIIGTQGILWDVTDKVAAEQILAKRARELETVAEVGTIISTILDSQQLLQTVVDLIKERFDLYHAHVYLLNSVGDTLTLSAGAGEVGRQMVQQGWQIPLYKEQSLVARAARTEMGFIVNNVQEEPGWLPNPSLPKTRAELAVPLVLGGLVLGVIDVQADKTGYFQDEDLHIQTILAAQVAVAIQNAEQHEKTSIALTESEILAREQTVLYELGQALTARLNVDQVLEEAYRQASRLIDTSNFYIGLYDEENQKIRFPFMVSDSDVDRKIKTIPVTQGIAGYVIRNKTSLLFEDDVQTKQEAIGIARVGQEAQSWLGVPLMIGDRVLGVMAVQTFTTPGLYNEHSRELLSAIGSQVAIALQNATLFESIVQAQVESEARLKETQILQKFTQALAATQEVSEVIDAFFEAGITLLNADYAIFSLVDRTQQRVRAISGYNVSQEHVRRADHRLDSDDIMADIIRTGKTELITGWDERFDVGVFTSEGMEEWGLKIFTPITIRQETVGLVEVGFKEKVDVSFQETQVELLRTLIDQAAISLESVQRYEVSHKTAQREQAIREITNNLRAASNLEELVQTVTTELGQYFSAEYALVELGIEKVSNGDKQ